MPKPPEAPATTAASKDDVEAESYNIRLAHLNESAGVIRVCHLESPLQGNQHWTTAVMFSDICQTSQ
jgi:hypothetical protein